MSTKRFGLAVIGLGRIGAIHLNNLLRSSRATVKWAVESDLQVAGKVLGTLNSPPQCVTPDKYQLVLQDETVDGVIICSPTSYHEEQVKAALTAGKAVLSEKPITSDINTTRSCYDLAESVRRPLLCAFNRRFDSSYGELRTNIAAETSGRLRLLRLSSHDENPPPEIYIRNSGGIFKDSTIHDFDMTLWLSQSPAKKIFAQGQAFDPAVETCGDRDLVLVIIKHLSGSISVIDNGRRCAQGYDQRIEAICDNGNFVVTNKRTNLLYRHTATTSTMPVIDRTCLTRYAQSYQDEIEHFLDVLAGDSTPRITKSDVLSAMSLAEAAANSAKSGQPVHLS